MPEKLPLVSIAAICFNHNKFLVETLKSIKNQTYKNLEVIVVDDCSQDNSVSIIKEWLSKNNLNWRFIIHEENLGLCKTLNEALSLLKGKYIQIIACDDILYPDKIEKQVKLFNESPEDVYVLCADLELIDSESKTTGFDRNIVETDYVSYKDILKETFVRAPSVLIKKQIFDVVGNYDESLYFEDWDMWLRIVNVGRIRKENRINVKYRVLSTSMYRQRKGNKESLLTSFLIIEKQLPAAREYRKLINRRFIINIEHLYVNNRKFYWLRKILKNKFSVVPIIHFIAASLGFKYEQGKAFIRFFKSKSNIIFKSSPGGN